jgi:hypothetical protein
MKNKMVSCGVLMFLVLVGSGIGFGAGAAAENKPGGMDLVRVGGVHMDSPQGTGQTSGSRRRIHRRRSASVPCHNFAIEVCYLKGSALSYNQINDR